MANSGELPYAESLAIWCDVQADDPDNKDGAVTLLAIAETLRNAKDQIAYLTEMHLAANARADRAEARARYWRHRAKSAEGHLWGSDHEAAERAVHAASVLHATPWDDLTNQQRWAVSRVVSGTIAAINGRRHARLPKDDAIAKGEAQP